MWAAFFNFAAFLVFGDAVASTIANDVVVQNVLSIGVIFAGLVGAIIWDLITFWLGLPTSPSHALVGGMAGAAVAKAASTPSSARACARSACSSCCRALIGLAMGLVFTLVIFWVFHRNKNIERLNRGFRHGQLAPAAAFSLGHGANDAQKTMGIILALLIASGHAASDAATPLWVVLAAHTAIGLGTLTGGWRIVKTMGSKITRLQPVGGVAAESAAAVTLFATSGAGIPVSTTHTITGAIVGVGAARRLSAVRWGWRGGWCGRILTIPGAFAIAYLTYLVVDVLPRGPDGPPCRLLRRCAGVRPAGAGGRRLRLVAATVAGVYLLLAIDRGSMPGRTTVSRSIRRAAQAAFNLRRHGRPRIRRQGRSSPVRRWPGRSTR